MLDSVILSLPAPGLGSDFDPSEPKVGTADLSPVLAGVPRSNTVLADCSLYLIKEGKLCIRTARVFVKTCIALERWEPEEREAGCLLASGTPRCI